MRPLRDMPIKQKVTVIAMAVAAVALALSGAGYVVADSILYRGSLERDISALAQIVADNSTAALAFDDPAVANQTLASLKAREHLAAACVYRAAGGVFAEYARPGSGAKCSATSGADEVRFVPAGLRVQRPIVLASRRIGTVVLLYDLGEVAARIRLYGATVLGLLLIAGLAAYLLSAKLSAVIAKPISRLAQAASSVSVTGDYTIRVPRISSDELGVLVDGFNEMLARIESQDAELRKALQAQQEAFEEARKARDSLQTTLTSIGDAVISTDNRGRVVFANPVAQSLLHRREAEIAGRELDEVFRVVNELSRERVESPVAQVLREGRIVAVSNDSILLGGDGTETPIDDSAAPIRGENGVVMGTVLVFRDVTVRRRADEARRLLASLVESTDDAVVGSDLNGIITSWNRGAERMYGYTPEEAVGRPLTMLSVSGGTNEPMTLLEAVRRGQSIVQQEAVRRTKDGKRLNVSLTISPVYDALGRIVGGSAIARDITEQVRSAERLAELNADLQRSNEVLARTNQDLERFAFIASHDLQEPLRMITTYTQLLIKSHRGQFDDEANLYVGNIIDGTKRMRELLVDLRTYTELRAPDEAPADFVDLNAVVESVLHNLQAAIGESHAVITSERLPALRVQRAHMQSLFQNLIGNAIKYRGPQPPRIHIASVQSAGGLQLTVSDNGIGIAPEYHEKIFEVFKRLHGQRIPGTGVGLAICQRIVERYGGRIWVESGAGQGATFRFTLPQVVVQSVGGNA